MDHGSNIKEPFIGNISLLRWAVQEGREKIVKYLIDHGADVNKDIIRGSTLLQSAQSELKKFQDNFEKKEKYEKIIEMLKAARAK